MTPCRPRSGRSTTSSMRRATPAASRPSRSRPASCLRPRPGRWPSAAAVARTRRSRRRPGSRPSPLAVVVLAIGYAYDLCASRARPGRGCRSRSGSRSCPSSAGSGPRAACRRPSRSCCPSRSSPAPRWRSPTPGPTSSATPRRASIGRDPAGARAGLGGQRRPARRGRRPWPLATLMAEGAPPVAIARRASAPASLIAARRGPRSRTADSAGRERAWELEAVGVGVLAAAWLAAPPGSTPRSVAGVVAPDQGDRVLEAELGDRQVLRRGWPGRWPRSIRATRRCSAPRRGRRRRRRGSAWR